LNNQNNSKILQGMRPKCPGSAIGAKQKSARSAVNKHDLDMLMGALVLALECTDSV
jgi:hypothetical protein